MAYIKDGKIGTLFELLPKTSNPLGFSEEELLELGVTKYTPEVIEVVLSLEETQAKKNEEIKRVFIELSNEGFECSNGIRLDCRESDKINWLGSSLQNLDNYTIKDYNNIVHNVTNEEFMLMFSELQSYYEKLLGDKWKLNTLVDSGLDIENIYWRKPIYEGEDMEEVLVGYEYNPILEE